LYVQNDTVHVNLQNAMFVIPSSFFTVFKFFQRMLFRRMICILFDVTFTMAETDEILVYVSLTTLQLHGKVSLTWYKLNQARIRSVTFVIY